MSQYLSQTRIEEPIWLEADDIHFLRKRISEAETQLGSLDGQIDQRDAKLVDIAACRNILSPIRRVPLEILAEILVLVCLPSYGWCASYDIIRYTSILSRVCVAWRKAAHNTPQLWSNLCISPSYPEFFDGQFVWLKEWVDRCQGHSLDLYLALPAPKSRKGQKLSHSILHFSHKIRVLHVSGHWSSLLPLIDYSSFPLLEEVDFEVNGFSDAYDTVELLPPQKIYALLGAPKLRFVTMREFTDLSFLTVLMLPAEQLTSLKITSVFNFSKIYVNLLRRCENLVNLELHYDSDVRPMDNARINLPICLPLLKSVSLNGNLLEYLTAPCIEELTLWCNPVDYFHCCSRAVDAFQQRSRTTLSTLYFENFDDDDEEDKIANITEDLIAILSLFPTVSMFGIKNGSFNINPLLRALTVDESRQVLLPKLEHLSLRIDACADYSSELKALILSRWWPDDDMDGCVSDHVDCRK
ncbi:hypothetical protein BT96DRAFT_989891 [Gymnopus androsaceus JB14]|uniref:Uncharacterized protein n=1 Tax=Gymnopus androsaceus JB14 TaxID=1447944 RepID=A0A6A4HZD5_9AGAR|nr:hypothetical protein BT96DRAFT_989891 [Gymnopus androsaceus JB14]